MALHTLRCNHVTPLRFKGLIRVCQIAGNIYFYFILFYLCIWFRPQGSICQPT